jgi:hypothetical protein
VGKTPPEANLGLSSLVAGVIVDFYKAAKTAVLELFVPSGFESFWESGCIRSFLWAPKKTNIPGENFIAVRTPYVLFSSFV